ncbi:plastocyanin [Bradyrhizobium sp. GM22.5]
MARLFPLRTGELGFQITAAIMAGLFAGAALAAAPYTISQKDREFRPREIIIKRGETLRFVNDDGELLHHAYLSAGSFDFDTGDQQPGSQVEVVFSVPGDYTVLCGIHPKMKLGRARDQVTGLENRRVEDRGVANIIGEQRDRQRRA